MRYVGQILSLICCFLAFSFCFFTSYFGTFFFCVIFELFLIFAADRVQAKLLFSD